MRRLGWAVLLLGLPMALYAAIHPPNEYRATLGIDALDCDGPFVTYMLAVPSLLLYGAALIINARQWRKPVNLIVAIACLVICGAVAANLASAIAEDRRQHIECSA
jgi:hypothetical protein